MSGMRGAREEREAWNARFLDALGLDVPAGEVVLQDADEPLLWVVTVFCAACQDVSATLPCHHTANGRHRDREEGERERSRETHPKMRSGWDMKSVIRSSMLRGSRTKVGKVTLWRSIPTLLWRVSRRGGGACS